MSLFHPRLPSLTWAMFPLPQDCIMSCAPKRFIKAFCNSLLHRNHADGMSRRADAAHLALPSSSVVTTCCIGPNVHLHGATSGEPGCNRNHFEAWFVADCSVPAICNTVYCKTSDFLSVVPSIFSLTAIENKRNCQVWKAIHL